MGINLEKIHAGNHLMISPVNIENIDLAGSIYLVIHRPKSQMEDYISSTTDKPIEKTSHFGIAVDITGSSSNHQFVATHFDLCVKSPTDYTTYIDANLKRHTWQHYTVRKMGQIPLHEITRFHMPHQFAVDLLNRLSQQVYSELFIANNGPQWSSILNCQTMTRACIQFLGCEFPADIQLITDIVPTMFDPYLNGSLVTAQVCQKSKDTLPC